MSFAKIIALLHRSTKPTKHQPHKLTWQRLRAQGDGQWYQAYLRSHHWRRRRKEVIKRAGYKCSACNKPDVHEDRRRGTRLHVHHVSYERVGQELDSDLRVLCRICHKRVHGR